MRNHGISFLRVLAPLVRRWSRRYLAQEVAAWIGAVGLGWTVHGWTGRLDAMALAGIAGEYAGFYGVALLRARWCRPRRPWLRVLRALVAEFALPELLDLLVVRPLALVAATRLTGSAPLGILVGGLAADLLFYGAAGLASSPATRRRN